MSNHTVLVEWDRSGDGFTKGRYSREHTWTFDGGAVVAASPSPSVVHAPYSNPENVDPEEAFVAAIASCHMLSFLYLASRAGVAVTSYRDQAVGKMTKNERGVPWVSEVELHPRIVYLEGQSPSPEQEQELHHGAHEQCFIANSVKTEIRVVADALIEHP
jgi:organic hydroperoxide reductase OsmC/OhrA